MKQTIPRIVRIGDIDVEIKEHREYPPDNYQAPSRIWFVAPSGLETSTYGEMLDKLGARPKPVLPEDEYRASSAADAAPPVRRRTEAHDKPALFKGAYPWTNDTRPNEELSEDEIEMQRIWYAEQIRERNPDLYEAALDFGETAGP